MCLHQICYNHRCTTRHSSVAMYKNICYFSMFLDELQALIKMIFYIKILFVMCIYFFMERYIFWRISNRLIIKNEYEFKLMLLKLRERHIILKSICFQLRNSFQDKDHLNFLWVEVRKKHFKLLGDFAEVDSRYDLLSFKINNLDNNIISVTISLLIQNIFQMKKNGAKEVKIIENPGKNIKFNSLSKVIQNTHVEEQKLSLVQRAIQNIDLINPKFHNIKILYLSGNFIEDLRNIGQFKMLKVLSLASNSITKIHTLKNLSQLRHLQNLSLSGNPVTKHILYKSFVISYCPNLRLLDKITISQNQRQQNVNHKISVDFCFVQLIRNYMQLSRICMFSKKIDIHKQINPRYKCNISKYEIYLKLSIISQNQIYQYYMNGNLWENLYRDCYEIYMNFSVREQQTIDERFLAAIKDMLTRQQLKIAELQIKLEKKINHLFPRIGQQFSTSFIQEQDEQQSLSGAQMSDLFINNNKSDNSEFKKMQTIKTPKDCDFQTTNQHKQNQYEQIQLNKKKLQMFQQIGIKNVVEIFEKFEERLKKGVLQLMIQINDNQQLKINRINDVLRKRKLLILWKALENNSNTKNKIKLTQHDLLQMISVKRINKQQKKKYFRFWCEEYERIQIQKHTQQIYLKFEEFKQKENKYKKKIELMDKLFQLSKCQWEKQKKDLMTIIKENYSDKDSIFSKNIKTEKSIEEDQAACSIEKILQQQKNQQQKSYKKTRNKNGDVKTLQSQYCTNNQLNEIMSPTNDAKENYQNLFNKQRILNKRSQCLQYDTQQISKRKKL